MKRAQTIILLLVSAWAGPAMAEEPLYVAVDCMKSTARNYPDLEREVWQPVHQYLVEAGTRESWALYSVAFGDRSRCDYYTVTTFRGVEQLNADPGYGEAFAEVHPRMDARDIQKTVEAREHVATELWLLIDQTDIRAHRFAIVNRMYAEDPVAYESMESKVFKAGHQVLIDRGLRAGWAVYSLVSPAGSSIPYNYGTVDFVNEIGPVPMADAMMSGNPDRDLDAMDELLALRDHVLSETWALVAATTDPR